MIPALSFDVAVLVLLGTATVLGPTVMLLLIGWRSFGTIMGFLAVVRAAFLSVTLFGIVWFAVVMHYGAHDLSDLTEMWGDLHLWMLWEVAEVGWNISKIGILVSVVIFIPLQIRGYLKLKRSDPVAPFV